MPAQTNLSLLDSQSTPVTHMFYPAGSRLLPNGVVESVFIDSDHNDGTELDRYTITERFTKATGRQTVDRMSYDLALGIGGVVDGNRKILRTPRFVGTFYLPVGESVTFLSQTMVGLVSSMLAHADIRSNVIYRRAFW